MSDYSNFFDEHKIIDLLQAYVENDRELLCLLEDVQKGLSVEDEIKNIIEMQEEIENEIERRCEHGND